MANTMLVNQQSAKMCCSFCYPEFGHSNNRTAKRKFARKIKRSERQQWKKELY